MFSTATSPKSSLRTSRHSGQELFWQWVMSDQCFGVFAAPPCGTCSLARNIPIKVPGSRRGRGPPPLRSKNHPDGLPKLTWNQRARVGAANKLYSFLTDVALYCVKNNKTFCMENPRNSLYWLTSYVQPLFQFLKFTAHQACAYGGHRPKWTALLHNNDGFLDICKTCPGESQQHVHKPWGYDVDKQQLSPKEEAAYPLPLAHAIASVRTGGCSQRFVATKPNLQLSEGPTLQHLRAVTSVQPKASKLPPLVAEFQTIVHRKRPLDDPDPCAPGGSLQQEWHGVPPGAKYLKLTPIYGQVGDTTEISALEHHHRKIWPLGYTTHQRSSLRRQWKLPRGSSAKPGFRPLPAGQNLPKPCRSGRREGVTRGNAKPYQTNPARQTHPPLEAPAEATRLR